MVEVGFLIVISFLFLRSLLIVVGWYKNPVLQRFEHYGTERIFSPILSLVLWALVLLAYFIIVIMGFTVMIGIFVLLSLPVVAYYDRLRHFVRDHPDLFMFYPRWYWLLVDRTSREERRRIAYLWLRLPFRTRLLYSTSDKHFEQWADLVLLSIA